MTASHLFIGESLRTGFKKTKEHLGLLIVLMIISLVLSFVPGILGDFLSTNVHEVFGLVMVILSWIIQLFVGMAMILISLKLLDDEQLEMSDMKSLFPKAIPFVVASILYGLLVFVGFLLLIVPGVIWSIKYRYFAYFIIERGAGPIEALKLSGEATQGAKWDLLGFGLATGVVTVLGLLALVVGLVVAVPTVMIAQAAVYRMLTGRNTSSTMGERALV